MNVGVKLNLNVMKVMKVGLLMIVLLGCLVGNSFALDRYKKKTNDQMKNKPKPPTLNTDLVPSLEKIVEEIGLTHRLNDLYKMGVVDTRILLRLKKMDFHMMNMEWSDAKEEEINALKEAVERYAEQATVHEEQVQERDFSERNRLTFGRLHIPNSVQAFEYLSASFGSVPPIGVKEIVINDDIKGCSSATTQDLTDKIVITQRGECSFLQKALNAKRAGASVLAVVNDVDKIDNIASGFGVDKNVTEAMINEVAKLSIVSLSSQALIPLQHAVKTSTFPLKGQIIPVKCGVSGSCDPVIEEEKVNLEVTSGTMRINGHPDMKVTRSFDFLTSTYGSVLPSNIVIQRSSPTDACQQLEVNMETQVSSDGSSTSTDISSSFALFAHRGGCRFEMKAQNAQNAGADLLIIANMQDEALQRVGAAKEALGALGAPSILVSMMAGRYIEELMKLPGPISIEIIPNTDNVLSKAWIDLAFTSFEEMSSEDEILALDGLIEAYIDHGSQDITAWLERRKRNIQSKNIKTVPAS